MQSASTAECNQDELAGIVAALNRDHANGLLHRCIHHPDDACSQLFEREVRAPLFKPLADNSAGALDIQREFSAQKTMCGKPPQQEIGIRDRGLSASAVADGPGIGASRFRPDTQRTTSVEAGN